MRARNSRRETSEAEKFNASYDKTIAIYCCRLLVIKVCAALFTCISVRGLLRGSGVDGSPPAKAQPHKPAYSHVENSQLSRPLSRKFGVCDLAKSSLASLLINAERPLALSRPHHAGLQPRRDYSQPKQSLTCQQPTDVPQQGNWWR